MMIEDAFRVKQEESEEKNRLVFILKAERVDHLIIIKMSNSTEMSDIFE